jgi:hypothetical protein
VKRWWSGKYDPSLGARRPRVVEVLDFGMAITLAEARLLLAKAYRSVERGESPSRDKVQRRGDALASQTIGDWADLCFAEAKLADATRAMRRSVYQRHPRAEFGRLKPEAIAPRLLLSRCQTIKERGAAAPSVQAGEIVQQILRFMAARGIAVDYPAEAIQPNDRDFQAARSGAASHVVMCHISNGDL